MPKFLEPSLAADVGCAGFVEPPNVEFESDQRGIETSLSIVIFSHVRIDPKTKGGEIMWERICVMRASDDSGFHRSGSEDLLGIHDEVYISAKAFPGGEADFSKDPWKLQSDYYDQVIAWGIADKICLLLSFLDECRRILKPHGLLFSTCPTRWNIRLALNIRSM